MGGMKKLERGKYWEREGRRRRKGGEKEKEEKEGLRMIGIVYDRGLCVNRGESALPLPGFAIASSSFVTPGMPERRLRP